MAWFMISQKLINFFSLGGLVSIFSSQPFDVNRLLSISGVEQLIVPIFPILLVVEVAFILWVHRRSPAKIYVAYKVSVAMYVVNFAIATLVNLDVLLWTQQKFFPHAPFSAPVNIFGFAYAYVVWELSHFVFHWTCHKVRLLWILHAPHHAPGHMNLGVIYTAFFLMGTYATFVRTAICSLLGVSLQLLFLCMIIDACWGSLIHFSEELWPSGKFGGVLDKWILTPSDHRVHHSNNPEYIDKNYCNTLPIWDKLFGTLQREIPGVRPRYGLNRPQKPNSFIDMYFGEIGLLWRDIKNENSFKNRIFYLIKPPGWVPAERTVKIS